MATVWCSHVRAAIDNQRISRRVPLRTSQIPDVACECYDAPPGKKIQNRGTQLLAILREGGFNVLKPDLPETVFSEILLSDVAARNTRRIETGQLDNDIGGLASVHSTPYRLPESVSRTMKSGLWPFSTISHGRLVNLFAFREEPLHGFKLVQVKVFVHRALCFGSKAL